MCGIAGIVALGRPIAPGEAVIEAMTAALAHRGPDGDGFWRDEAGRAVFGHRRLSIIDLDSRAAQPMVDATQRCIVTFNGEIYNHAALRAELEAAGHRFLTDHSDTEVLLVGYLAWGIAGLLDRLNGMFAFALFDRQTGETFLCRDRLGIKPLYFMEHDGRLAFGSEIKALLAQPGVPRRMCTTAVYHYLTFATAPAPLTMFEGIAKLPAGHFLTVSANGRVIPTRYWDPAAAIAAGSKEEDAAQATRRLLEGSVQSMMMAADVPVGLFLSGGVDSGSALALMSRLSNGPVRTFTVGFRNGPAELDEIETARDQALRHGTDHHQVLVDEGEAQAVLWELVRSQDEPLADWVCLPLYFVARLARQNGIKTVLVGEGADELFCGYAAYLRSLRTMATFRRTPRLPDGIYRGMRAIAGALLPASRTGLRRKADEVLRGLCGRQTFWSGAVFVTELNKALLYRGDAPASRPWDAYGLLDPALCQRDSGAIIEAMQAALAARAGDVDDLARLRHRELSLRLPELLLMRADKMTMAHSIEARVPFLDHDIAEFALGLPQERLIKGGRSKAVLKEAVADLLPPEVLDAKKKGFGAPVDRWLRGEFGREAEKVVTQSGALDEAGIDRRRVASWFAMHRSGGRDMSLMLWPIINLAFWHRYWIEGEAA